MLFLDDQLHFLESELQVMGFIARKSLLSRTCRVRARRGRWEPLLKGENEGSCEHGAAEAVIYSSLGLARMARCRWGRPLMDEGALTERRGGD
jgi:hypothetical protein